MGGVILLLSAEIPRLEGNRPQSPIEQIVNLVQINGLLLQMQHSLVS